MPPRPGPRPTSDNTPVVRNVDVLMAMQETREHTGQIGHVHLTVQQLQSVCNLQWQQTHDRFAQQQRTIDALEQHVADQHRALEALRSELQTVKMQRVGGFAGPVPFTPMALQPFQTVPKPNMHVPPQLAAQLAPPQPAPQPAPELAAPAAASAAASRAPADAAEAQTVSKTPPKAKAPAGKAAIHKSPPQSQGAKRKFRGGKLVKSQFLGLILGCFCILRICARFGC